MKKPSYKHSWYDPLQQLANHLDFSINHAIHIEYNSAQIFRNKYPQARLIFIAKTGDTGGGHIDVIINNSVAQTLPILAGTAMFFPPNLELTFNYEPGLTCFGFHFNLSIIPGVDIFESQSKPCVIPYSDTQTLNRLRAAIWEKSSLRDLLWSKGTLLAIASGFIEKNELKNQLSLMNFSKKYAPVLAHLNANPRIDKNFADLAKTFNITFQSLARNFRRDAGITLHAWLAQQVVREIDRRLSESDEPLKTISGDLGFSNSVYFNRFVKKHLSLSPKAYREAHKQSPETSEPSAVKKKTKKKSAD